MIRSKDETLIANCMSDNSDAPAVSDDKETDDDMLELKNWVYNDKNSDSED